MKYLQRALYQAQSLKGYAFDGVCRSAGIVDEDENFSVEPLLVLIASTPDCDLFYCEEVACCNIDRRLEPNT